MIKPYIVVHQRIIFSLILALLFFEPLQLNLQMFDIIYLIVTDVADL